MSPRSLSLALGPSPEEEGRTMLPSPTGRRVGDERRGELLLDRHDLLALIFDHDVVVFVERIVDVGLERLFIRLDQPFVFTDLVKAFANLVAVGAAARSDGERGQ